MGMRLRLHGSVQGIGFRPWVGRLAREFGLRGRVANTPDGVWIDVFGADAALAGFRARVAAPPLPGAGVESIQTARIAGRYLPFGPYLALGIGIALLHWDHVLRWLAVWTH